MQGTEGTLPERFRVVALVCSLGGFEALTAVVARLPRDFPAAVIALQHTSPVLPSRLPELLRHRTALSVCRAEDGDPLEPGRLLVVPEGVHMLVVPGPAVRLIAADGTPRPSADLLLCTLAVTMGPDAIAVVLTGAGGDGATGAAAVHRLGGVTLVEEPATAFHPGMPEAALRREASSAALPLHAIAPALLDLVMPENRPGTASAV